MRFLSHHECLRLVQRAAARAELPVRMTRGFNPHPRLRLVLPRPVGVASRDELATAALDAPIEAASALTALNAACPAGMEFFRAAELPPGPPVQARRAEYAWRGRADSPADLARRAAAFHAAEHWPLDRARPPGRGGAARTRQIDLRALVTEMAYDADAGELRWVQLSDGGVWARLQEVLHALGLDDPADLADVERRRVDYGT